MSKTVIPLNVQLIKYETSLAFAEVISRLDNEVNKAGSSEILRNLNAAKDDVEVRSAVNNIVGERTFLYFLEFPFEKLLQKFAGGTPQPGLVVYTIGNPLFAQGIMQHNRLAGYSIPPRLLISENPDRSGTVVTYHLPSSVMGVPEGENGGDLKERLESLDGKLERLVVRITAVTD